MSNKTAIHPDGTKIFFTEEDHRYTDDHKRIYNSTTTVIHALFPPFDKESISRSMAIKAVGSGKSTLTVEEEQSILLKKWDDKRINAANMGTYVHSFAEALLTNQDPMSIPIHSEKGWELAQSVQRFIPSLLSNFRFICAEQIIFSPTYRISGTVDLIMENDDEFAILDWKTNENIHNDSYNKTGLMFLSHIPCTNFWKYALQLSVYSDLIQSEKYYTTFNPKMKPVKLYLLHVQKTQVVPMECPILNNETRKIFTYAKNLNRIVHDE
jgi:ATP-dependent exoDNAse (exonuclease V) beta subunit